MKFRINEKRGIVFIELQGDMIGGPDAVSLADRLRELLEEGRNRIVLDMKEVTWMNSSGMGILIGGLTTVRKSGGDLKLLNLTSKLKDILRITKLEHVFEIFDDEDSVIESFS